MTNWQEQFDNATGRLFNTIPLSIRWRDSLKAFIQSLLDQQKKELLEKVTLGKSKLPRKLNTPWGKVDATANEHFNEGYNQAVSDLEILKKSLS